MVFNTLKLTVFFLNYANLLFLFFNIELLPSLIMDSSHIFSGELQVFHLISVLSDANLTLLFSFVF